MDKKARGKAALELVDMAQRMIERVVKLTDKENHWKIKTLSTTFISAMMSIKEAIKEEYELR